MNLNNQKIGILGGGQLGRMLANTANDYGVELHIMDPNPEAPCSTTCQNFIVGDINDFDAVYNFGKNLKVISIEIERVNVEALKKLQGEGVKVIPSPEIIETIQDKGLQKNFFKEHGIPTAEFELMDDSSKITTLQSKLPFVQKTRRDGYDGRGVKVCRTEEDLKSPLKGASVIENLVPIKQELAVIVARNPKGEVAIYDPVEMQMDPTLNLVDFLSCPANCPEEILKEAQVIAETIAKKFDLVGIMAIEMFVTKDNQLLVNELAPRPHNSGHHSIEACYTSQYTQLLLCLLNLPLGDTKLYSPAVMLNLIGEDGHDGIAAYPGIDKPLPAGTFVHIYGKKNTRPGRKMGHLTILADSVDSALEKAKIAKSILKVTT